MKMVGSGDDHRFEGVSMVVGDGDASSVKAAA